MVLAFDRHIKFYQGGRSLDNSGMPVSLVFFADTVPDGVGGASAPCRVTCHASGSSSDATFSRAFRQIWTTVVPVLGIADHDLGNKSRPTDPNSVPCEKFPDY